MVTDQQSLEKSNLMFNVVINVIERSAPLGIGSHLKTVHVSKTVYDISCRKQQKYVYILKVWNNHTNYKLTF